MSKDENGYKPYGPVEPITVTGQYPNATITYYDIYKDDTDSRKDTSNKVQFLQDAILKQNLLHYWSQLAYQIFKSNSKIYFDHAGNGWDKDFGEDHYMDLIYHLQNTTSDKKVKSTGLTYCKNLNDVQKAADSSIADFIDRKVKADDFKKHSPIDELDDDTQRDVFYTLATIYDRYGGTFQYAYDCFGIAFYDFELNILSDGTLMHTALGNMTLEEAIEKGSTVPGFSYSASPGKKTTSSVTNGSAQDVASEQTIKKDMTLTDSNSMTNTKEYSFSEMIGADFEVSKVLPHLKITARVEFTAGQVLSTAYTETKSVSETDSQSASISLSVPAHTEITIEQETTGSTVTLSYDCPVSISYKTALFALCGTFYDDNCLIQSFTTAGYHQRSFISMFGNSSQNAIENLYSRAVVNKDVPGNDKASATTCGREYDEDDWMNSLDWNSLFKNKSKPKSKNIDESKLSTTEELVTQLTKNAPMSPTGGTLASEATSIHSTVYDAVALYHLKRIKTMDGTVEYNIGLGDIIYASNIGLQGFNEQGVLYYGFSSDKGHWSLVDEDDNELEDDSIAVLETDPASGIVTVKGKGAGTAYMKYWIDEGAYLAKDGVMATNSNISTARIKVIVHDTKLDGTIKVKGSVTAYADDEPLNLDTLDTITAYVYDETGREISVPVIWEAQELSSRGITVEHNKLTVTKKGDFHIRAAYEGIHSNWASVTALDHIPLD